MNKMLPVLFSLTAVILLGVGCEKTKQVTVPEKQVVQEKTNTPETPPVAPSAEVPKEKPVQQPTPDPTPKTTVETKTKVQASVPKPAQTVPTKTETTPAPQTETKPEPTPTPAPPAPKPVVKEFTMTAKNWDFIPSTITVKKGDTVRLHIKSVDVDHGFNLSAFNVKTLLQPNETATVEFVADKVGNHSFFCSVFCGSGHQGMKGTLVVEE